MSAALAAVAQSGMGRSWGAVLGLCPLPSCPGAPPGPPSHRSCQRPWPPGAPDKRGPSRAILAVAFLQ